MQTDNDSARIGSMSSTHCSSDRSRSGARLGAGAGAGAGVGLPEPDQDARKLYDHSRSSAFDAPVPL